MAILVTIKENSWLAWLAAKVLQTNSVAVVLGKTIYLYNITKLQFVKNKPLMCHELMHVKQYVTHKYLPFLIAYMWESLKKGYYWNKFEVEAREHENDFTLLQQFYVL